MSKFVVALFFLSTLALQCSAQQTKAKSSCYSKTRILAPDGELTQVERIIQDLVENGASPSISVVVVRQGTVIWDKAYGWADKENKVLASTDTVYAVGSVSKAFTGTALSVLVADKVIDGSQPVRRYLKTITLQTHAGEPTVNQLISMRAGVPHGWEYAEELGRLGEAWEKHAFVAFAPGEQFLYSNIAFGIAGVLVSDSTGIPLGDAVTKLVFAPLGMTHSALYPSPNMEPFMAVGYSRRGRLPRYPISPHGGAGFSSSTRDLARLGMLHAGVKGCSLPSLDSKALKRFHGSSYAFGWGHLEAPNKRNVFLSNGEVQGGRADILVVPEDRTVIVVNQNTHSGSTGTDELTFAIADKLMPGFSAMFQTKVKQSESSQVLPIEALSGEWKGEVLIDGYSLPVSLKISNGAAVVTISGSEPQAAKRLAFTKDGLTGDLEIPIPVSWARDRSQRSNFRLIRTNNFLKGFMFVQTADDRPSIGLPLYLSLKQQSD